MNLMCIKTVNNEDLVGECNFQSDVVTIKDPLMIIVMPAGTSSSGQQQFSIGLTHYMPFSKEEVYAFKNEHVVLRYEPVDEIKNDYSRITGKGIILPPKPKIELVP
jgi:hypothetical protein